MKARLIRIDPPPTDWWDLKRWSNYVYRTEEDEEETVSEFYVPEDCRKLGCEVVLQYTYFSHGGNEGYNFQPRKFVPAPKEDDTYTTEA
jgi:hypothetical protein